MKARLRHGVHTRRARVYSGSFLMCPSAMHANVLFSLPFVCLHVCDFMRRRICVHACSLVPVHTCLRTCKHWLCVHTPSARKCVFRACVTPVCVVATLWPILRAADGWSLSVALLISMLVLSAVSTPSTTLITDSL